MITTDDVALIKMYGKDTFDVRKMYMSHYLKRLIISGNRLEIQSITQIQTVSKI